MGLKEKLRKKFEATLARERRVLKERISVLQKRKAAARQAYAKEVANQLRLRAAKRKAYEEGSIIQAKLKGQRIAKARYNRPHWTESVKRSIILANKPKKVMKKKSKRKKKSGRRTVVKYVYK